MTPGSESHTPQFRPGPESHTPQFRAKPESHTPHAQLVSFARVTVARAPGFWIHGGVADHMTELRIG